MTQIKLKGISSLEGIQFLFNNGSVTLESPFISSCESNGNSPQSFESTRLESEVITYNIEKKIASIKVTVDKLVLITGLEMRYANGTVALSHTFDPRGIAFK